MFLQKDGKLMTGQKLNEVLKKIAKTTSGLQRRTNYDTPISSRHSFAVSRERIE